MSIILDYHWLLIPPSGRWTARHKLALLEAFNLGAFTIAELEANGISAAEWAEWQNGWADSGLAGLKTTKRVSIRGHKKTRRRPTGKQ